MNGVGANPESIKERGPSRPFERYSWFSKATELPLIAVPFGSGEAHQIITMSGAMESHPSRWLGWVKNKPGLTQPAGSLTHRMDSDLGYLIPDVSGFKARHSNRARSV